MKRTADVVVIGAGINGASTAYHLGKRGVRNVVLLEKRFVASGPTGLSSGVVRQHYTIQTLALMARDSLKVLENFESEVGGSAGFVKCGAVFLAGEQDSAQIRASVEKHQRLGIRTAILSPEEIRELDPQVYTADISCAAYEPDSGYADPALTANSFCEAAKREGVEILLRCPVTGLKVEHGKIKGVITTRGEIATNVVLNIAGPWGVQIAAMVGAKIPITSSRHCVVVLQRPLQWRSPTPSWADFPNASYFKPDGTAGIMVGSLSPDEALVPVDIDSYSQSADYETVSQYAVTICKRFPVMAEGIAKGGWAGLYDVTPDWQPVISPVPAIEGFYCAVGFSGHGFKLAPAVGKIMSELAVEGRCHSYDISMFRYERFQQGELTRSAYAYSIIG